MLFLELLEKGHINGGRSEECCLPRLGRRNGEFCINQRNALSVGEDSSNFRGAPRSRIGWEGEERDIEKPAFVGPRKRGGREWE